MAFCQLLLSVLTISVVCTATTVPVFIWGGLPTSALRYSPLSTIPSDEFLSVLKDELRENPFVVAFIDETLSVEDFSTKNDEGKSSLPYLHDNIKHSLYLPSVEDALTSLNDLADPEETDHIKLTENGLSAEIEPSSGKYLIISLKDAKDTESRSDLLGRHNEFMKDIIEKLQKKHDKVVGIYTAQYPSWTVTKSHSRVRRQAANASTVKNHGGLLFQYSNVTVNNVVLSSRPTVASNVNDTVMSSTLNYASENVQITLNFLQSQGYWMIDSAVANSQNFSEKLLQPSEDMYYALIGWSYRCGQSISFNTGFNDTNPVSVVFENVILQAFAGNATEFGDETYCNGFFSAPIWACLMVSFILLAIMFYGISMMFDIRTMDRFDDPKGKTITINTAE